MRFARQFSTIFTLTIVLALQVFVRADTEGPRVKLTLPNSDLEVGPKMNASRRTLLGCEFIGQNLKGADFTDSDLSGAMFYQCWLENTCFKRATIDLGGKCTRLVPVSFGVIKGADFSDAFVSWGKCKGSTIPASGWELSPEQLRSTRNYREKMLAHVKIVADVDSSSAYDFRGADLTGAAFVGGDFAKADLAGANITSLYLSGDCYIPFSTLSQAVPFTESGKFPSRVDSRRYLQGIHWSRARISGICDFSGMTLFQCSISAQYCDDVVLDSTLLKKSHFSHLSSRHLVNTVNCKRGDFSDLTFRSCDLQGFNFTGFDLSGIRFAKCNLNNAQFTDAVISHADFSSDACEGLTPEQFRTTWNFKHGRMQGIKLPAEIAKAVQGKQ